MLRLDFFEEGFLVTATRVELLRTVSLQLLYALDVNATSLDFLRKFFL